MPANLTDVSTFTNPIQVPDAGDPVGAGSGSYLRTALQGFANRTKFLYDILTSTGVTKVRKVASTALLKAIASPAEGDVAIVASGGNPQIFMFRSTALVGSDIAGARYDSTTVAGYWLSPWLALADLSGASPRLQNQSLPPTNRIVESFEVVDNSPTSVTWASSATWQSTDAQITVTGVEVDDIIEVTGSLIWSVDTGTEQVSVRIYRSDSGGAAAIAGSQIEDLDPIGANKLHAVTVGGRYVATAAGSHTITVQIFGDSGVPFNFSVHNYRTLRGRVIRP